MVALKGKPDIGDQINKKIIGPLANANKLSDMPDFNDATKLGSGKEMVDRLTNLIAIFENKSLDFSKNRAEGDDILGDAYEYLMRHFATESGKSKGQFYTPAEISRIMAEILGIRDAKTTNSTTVYDPTCGSGSLLLKVGDEATAEVTLYGQEKDAATSGLARMNMILHNNPTALIKQGNTLANPLFTTEDGHLKTFDYVVANPPFSDKRWRNGLHPNEGGISSGTGEQTAKDYERFKHFGIPPAKQGDYAYLLHIVRSLKSNGKGACILPHGVLFRGNAEADIRKNLVRQGYIKGIIGLPANLFYGTGIPACIVVIDKEHAHTRKGIFMIDASSGFMKDGPKNRLRSMDLHKIVDAFTKQLEWPKYSRIVPVEEIEKHDFNLSIPRYIDNQQVEDIQDIDGHLRGGIPDADINALSAYWSVCPNLREALFKANRAGYLDLAVAKDAITPTIYGHPEFTSFISDMNDHFAKWRKAVVPALKDLQVGCKPKQVISALSEGLLAHYTAKPLIDKYDVYQHIMDYWATTMQDDCYAIAVEGWKAATYRILETKKGKDGKPGKQVDKGWACDLVPKSLVVARYFAKQREAITKLEADLEAASANLAELEEEHGGEDDAFAELDKVNKAEVTTRLKEIKGDKEARDEAEALNAWLKHSESESTLKKSVKDAEVQLDELAYKHYTTLTDADVKTLVVEDKWLAALDAAIHGEMTRVSRTLTSRVKELAERYETPLPKLMEQVACLEGNVSQHQNALQQLLTGKQRLPGFNGKWTRIRLDAIAEIRSGGTPSTSHPEYWGGGIPWCTPTDITALGGSKFLSTTTRTITTEGLRTSSAEMIASHSVVMTTRATIGACAINLLPITTNQGFKCFVPFPDTDAEFLYYVLQTKTNDLIALCGGSTFLEISKSQIARFEIDWPPSKAEQQAIAAILGDIDRTIEMSERKLTKIRRMKEASMHILLAGKCDLL